ncbi:hypothetical protein [Mammaliicoccus sp. N-M52]|uniref:hypothetical protein n=1 Tax=Mammaliicoccus sp. N-M52 TaxID=2898711 RepID=UPI001EFAD3E1|nr:hypothetical protein [Mammaliicoccus sp. N-M52]
MKIVKWGIVIFSPFIALFILMSILNITENTVLALLVMMILNIIGYFLLQFLSRCIVKKSILVTRKHPRLKLVLGILLLFIAWLGMGLNLDKIAGTGSVNVTLNAQVIALLVSLSYAFILLILNYEESKLD